MPQSKFELERRMLLTAAAFAGFESIGGDSPAQAQSVPAMPRPYLVDRAFVRLAEGPVHYRWGGTIKKGGPVPLYMAHAGPGSSQSFAPWIRELSADRFVFAPDMLGNGDSAPPARDETDIAYYVDCAVRIMDALKIPKVDFYGTHTGALIGCELAATHPDRVRKLVVDGTPIFPPDFRKQLYENYAPKMQPDAYGGHLAWAWRFVRDMSQFWPYFEQNAAHRLPNDVPTPDNLHPRVVDVLRALTTYHIAYRAAFSHDTAKVLPRIKVPTMLTGSERDSLSVYLDEAAALVPGSRKMLFARGTALTDQIGAVAKFLAV